MDLGLAGRTVVVTGGRSGIGLATIEVLLDEGANVATCARDADRLAVATRRLDAERLLAMRCDVRDRGSCETFVAAVVKRFGRLDALVNNAGQGRIGRLPDLTDEDWRAELDAKIFGVLNPVRAAIPHLQLSDAPRVVNVSAGTAREPDPDLLAVGAARAAVSNLSRGLAAELAPIGVLVNAVSVGVIATDRVAARHRMQAPGQPFDEWARAEADRRGIDLGRLGSAHEVAVAIVFLASPAASYITGATLDVAGGLNRSW